MKDRGKDEIKMMDLALYMSGVGGLCYGASGEGLARARAHECMDGSRQRGLVQ